MANQLELVYNNLGNMLEAGVPVVKALWTASTAASGRLRKAINNVAHDAFQGESLADSMVKTRQFKRLDIQLIRVGEISGGLTLLFKELANWYGLCNRISRTVKSGMVLPMVQFHFVAIFVPGILWLMSELSGSGNFTGHSAIKLGLGILSLFYIPAVVIFAIVRFTPQTGPLRFLLDAIVQLIPGMSYAFRHLALSRFFRNFQLCLNVGVPIDGEFNSQA